MFWTTFADDILQQYKWNEEKTLYHKPWFGYLEIHITTAVTAQHTAPHLIPTIKSMMFKSQVAHFVVNFPPTLIFEHEQLLIKGGKFPVEQVTALLFTIQAVIPKVFSTNTFVRGGTHIWQVLLHPELDSLITLVQFRICGHFSLCQSSVRIFKYTKPGDDFELFYQFCGVYSGFKLYTAVPRYLYRVDYKPTDDFLMFTSFDIIASHTGESAKFIRALVHEVQCYSLFSLIHEEVKTTMHITLNKTKQVVIFSNNLTKIWLSTSPTVFDGPGFFAPKHIFLSEASFFKCSTFQCILLITQNASAVASCVDLFSYSHILILPTKYPISVRDSVLWNLPKTQNILSITVDLFETAADSHVQVTPVKFSSSGEDHPLCLYGGVAFITVNKKQISSVIGNICHKNNNEFSFLKPVYSSQNTLLIVSYSYNKYSIFQGTLKISVTSCQLLKIFSCDNIMNVNGLNILNFLAMKKQTLGDFMRNAVADSIPLLVDSTAHRCTIAQIRYVNPNFVCGHHREGVQNVYFLSSLVVLEKRSRDIEMHKYSLEGMLMSMGNLHIEKSSWNPDSHLLVSGGGFHHSKDTDSNFTVFLPGQKKNVSHQSRFPIFYKNSTSNNFMVVEPPFSASLHYSLRFFADTPTDIQSLSFIFAVWGKFSWLDIKLEPVSRRKSVPDIHISGTAQSIPKTLQHRFLLLGVSKNNMERNSVVLRVQVEHQVSVQVFNHLFGFVDNVKQNCKCCSQNKFLDCAQGLPIKFPFPL